MPTYEFIANDGQRIERFYSFDEAPYLGKRIRVNRKTFTRCLSSERCHTAPPGNWPKWTTMQGAAPDQAGELHETLRRSGVQCDVAIRNNMASMRWESPKHMARCCHALGLQSKNAGYSDPVKR